MQSTCHLNFTRLPELDKWTSVQKKIKKDLENKPTFSVLKHINEFDFLFRLNRNYHFHSIFKKKMYIKNLPKIEKWSKNTI